MKVECIRTATAIITAHSYVGDCPGKQFLLWVGLSLGCQMSSYLAAMSSESMADIGCMIPPRPLVVLWELVVENGDL